MASKGYGTQACKVIVDGVDFDRNVHGTLRGAVGIGKRPESKAKMKVHRKLNWLGNLSVRHGLPPNSLFAR